uniref:Chorein N-terminal domain-containing protein n=2 Tax=Kalanchoe fedtschenkoi TaxID=63787 RepID=A0A7N0V5U2_KALFE
MESILARALEYTLKYWLKSFSRDQFKLQGRTAQLSNLDINGEALHSSMGLPPAMHVATAKVGKLQIMLPYVSYVQVEPIVVQIDRLDLVLEEKTELDEHKSTPLSTSSGKASGYGFADKIADGMTIEVNTVNLLIQTRGGTKHKAGAAWTPPVASITIRNLVLVSTNEKWDVVNLKEAREYSGDKRFIYVFKKLEWGSLSIDLLPHPDMFMDADECHFEEGANNRGDDGAKRVFFGGERFIDGISGQAYITLQRTELNCPLGLEVQIHVPEAVCPALSEPGLRALLRCLTGFYVCLSRGDVDPRSQQGAVEAAGRSIFSIFIDHVFICIKDAEFQLELLMQSLVFSRTSSSDGETAKSLTQIMVSGFFLRDTFTQPLCTLIQPAIEASESVRQPFFGLGQDFCPPIYPLGLQPWQLIVMEGIPLIYIRSLQIKPSPVPPTYASESFIDCQPLMIHFHEEAFLRIASFLSDGVVVGRGTVLPDFSINSIVFTLRELIVTVPMDMKKLNSELNRVAMEQSIFSGARLQIRSLVFSERPTLKFRILKLEKDPGCFLLWESQPADASQNKWTVGASHITLSLETSGGFSRVQSSLQSSGGLWKCVELKDPCIEVAMATVDGSPLTNTPPPGGLVRVGVSVPQYLSNTSVEQLFFVLDLYAYFGNVCEKVAAIGQISRVKISDSDTLRKGFIEKAPSDTAVSLTVNDIQLRFLEATATYIEGMPLVQLVGEDLFIKADHRTLGGAVVVSSTFRWQSVEVDCVDAARKEGHDSMETLSGTQDGSRAGVHFGPHLKAVFWVENQGLHQSPNNCKNASFLDVTVSNVIPLSPLDTECHRLSISACIAGVRLGGGMNYTESLLHRFGILRPDGGPGDGLSKGLDNLSAGPLSKLFKTSSPVDNMLEDGSFKSESESEFKHLGRPDDIDVSIELKDWLFALQGAQDMAESWWFDSSNGAAKEERSWHTSFRSFQVQAKTNLEHIHNQKGNSKKIGRPPVESIKVAVEGLQILKPQASKDVKRADILVNRFEQTTANPGVDLEAQLAIQEDGFDDEIRNWIVEKIKFSVQRPIEAVMTKDELQYLTTLCKSEVDSLGRIAAGVLQVFKLEGTVGQAGIDQLGNLSSEGLDKIFRPVNGSHNIRSTSLTQRPASSVDSSITLLDEAIQDSQAKCHAIIGDLSKTSESPPQLTSLKELTEKLENLRVIVNQLRTQL